MKKFFILMVAVLMIFSLTTTILSGPDWDDEPDYTEYSAAIN